MPRPALRPNLIVGKHPTFGMAGRKGCQKQAERVKTVLAREDLVVG
ncbi:MAG TPA: hypothetical protein VGK20_16465 [Candidatus Binatia bacterium]|jgi:hypothetical protein